MKFMRRPDLDPQTRIQIVIQAWLNQGVYGQMTHIAKFIRSPGPFFINCFWLPTSSWKCSLVMKSFCFKKIIGI